MELISVHVPKTAGSTFGNHLTAIYGADRVFKDYDDYPMNPLVRFNLDRSGWCRDSVAQIRGIGREVRVVHGHFAIEKYRGAFPEARRVAWVRHPAAWVVSLYYFWKNRGGAPDIPTNPLILRLLREDLPLLEFAEDPTVRNNASRVFLAGLAPEQFDFIGIQECFAEDLLDLARLMRWPNLPPGAENRNPEPGYGERARDLLGDPRTLDRLIELNEDDMAFYEAAVRIRRDRRDSRAAADRWSGRSMVA